MTLLPPRPRLLADYRRLTPLLAAACDLMRVPDADVVLSSSYAFAHRLRSRNDAPRLCYCHSPLRFAWSMTASYRREWAPRGTAGRAFEGLAAAMRWSDRRSAQGVARYLTQSPYTAGQIARFYGRRADVIGAPVDTDLFRPSGRAPDDYFLLSGRLIEPYKRASLAIEAFRGLPHRLLIAGDGPALPDLRATAPANVEFLGHLEDRALVEVMQGCRAGIFPSQDDFGLIPVEVMACGRPVLAFAGGGALHTIAAGVTGELFDEQTPQALRSALRNFRPEAYDTALVRAHAEQWAAPLFRDRLVEAVMTTRR